MEKLIRMGCETLVVENMDREKVVEEIRRAYVECGFVPPDVGDPSEVSVKGIERTIEEKRTETEGYALDILHDAVGIIVWSERGDWDKVSFLASRIASAVARVQGAADYAKRAAKLRERLLSILEKG
jgi:hypothetical protein